MLRCLSILLFVFLGNSIFAKEWKSLKAYQKSTSNKNLPPSDWLTFDRTNNTAVWQSANAYNLENHLCGEYHEVEERRDFYKWLYKSLDSLGHEVVWVKMAHFISKKIHVMEQFPFSLFTRKKIKDYAQTGNETVFNNAFTELNALYFSKKILKGKEADTWDSTILKQEQFKWIEPIYKTMDAKSLTTLGRIAKGKCFYSIMVPKPIRYNGGLANAQNRFDYAIKTLKPYCENRYKS